MNLQLIFLFFYLLRVCTREILFDCCLALLDLAVCVTHAPRHLLRFCVVVESRKYNLIINCANKFTAAFFIFPHFVGI